MRISDWSSDVCSSDLQRHHPRSARPPRREALASPQVDHVAQGGASVDSARGKRVSEIKSRSFRCDRHLAYIRQAIEKEWANGKGVVPEQASSGKGPTDRKSTSLNSSH